MKGVSMLNHLVASLLWLAVLPYGPEVYAGEEKQSFVDAVRAYKHTTKAANVNLDNLVAKYVPAGTSGADVVRFCHANGLKPRPSLNELADRTTADKIDCFVKVKITPEGKFAPWAPGDFLKTFGYDFYLYFKLSGGKVISARGYIALISL